MNVSRYFEIFSQHHYQGPISYGLFQDIFSVCADINQQTLFIIRHCVHRHSHQGNHVYRQRSQQPVLQPEVAYIAAVSKPVSDVHSARSFCVETSRSDANCANASISRYCANSSLILPATCFIAFVALQTRRGKRTDQRESPDGSL